MDMPRLPLFKISSDVFEAMHIDDIFKTAQDMDALGIYKPPFNEFFIQAKVKTIEKMANDGSDNGEFHFYGPQARLEYPKAEARFYFFFQGKKATTVPSLANDGKNFVTFDPKKVTDPNVKEWFSWMSTVILGTLVVLLATKNADKQVEIYNKPNSRNRREQRLSQFSSVTTISIGKITETMRSEGSSGASVRPHMRRGHIRHQHYGEGNSKTKKIFIEPVFVNADEGWITGRKTYRVVA